MFYSRIPIVLAAGFVLALPLNLWGEEICSVKLCKPEAREGWCFRPVSNEDGTLSHNQLLFMRTNPVASLACFKEQAEGASQAIQTLSAFYGYIGGDVKPDNVDMVHVGTKGDLQIGLIDLDDGGLGSLLVDVLHTLAYNQIWWKNGANKNDSEKNCSADSDRLKFADALAAYQAGLKGEKLKDALTLEQIREKFPRNKKQSNDWCKDGKPAKIQPLSEDKALATVWKQYVKDGNRLEKVLKKDLHMDIKDKGYDRKEHSGGSMCAVRFDYLVSVKSDKPDGIPLRTTH